METKETKMFGVISYLNEPAGYFFICQRSLTGDRKSWFAHISKVVIGEPQVGAKCRFREARTDPRGPSAFDIEVGDVIPKFAATLGGLSTLTGDRGAK
jgi:cold shock CspA family protein